MPLSTKTFNPHQRGFTIMELMVALTVGMLILVALSSVMVTSVGTRSSGDRNAQLQTNARFALDVLRRDVQHAGYTGRLVYRPQADDLGNEAWTKSPVTITTACSTNTGILRWPVEGSNNTNSFPGCIPAAEYVANTDVLLVRHAGANPVSISPEQRVANTLYFYSNPKELPAKNFTGLGTSTPSGAVTDGIYPVEENIYYIRPWSFSATEVPMIPALVRKRLGAAAGGPKVGGDDGNGIIGDTAELIASGVENMQIQYGMAVPGATNPAFSYQKFDTAFISPSNPVNMIDTLQTVQIWLLVRAPTIEPGYKNSTTYTLAGIAQPAMNDGYRRTLINSVIQVRRATKGK